MGKGLCYKSSSICKRTNGDGLGFDFKRLEFNIQENETGSQIIGFIDGEKSDWDFSIQFLDKEHVVAIASNQEFEKKEFEIQNASQVLKNSENNK